MLETGCPDAVCEHAGDDVFWVLGLGLGGSGSGLWEVRLGERFRRGVEREVGFGEGFGDGSGGGETGEGSGGEDWVERWTPSEKLGVVGKERHGCEK